MDSTKRTTQKRQTREKILRIAAEQFALHGFSVPTTGIARAAGVSHGTIFVHFPSREELNERVIQMFFEDLNAKIHLAAKGQRTVSDLLERHLDILQENEAFYTHLVLELTSLPESTQDKLFAYQSTLSFHFQSVLAKEMEQGRIKHLPQHMLFNMWMALVHYYLSNSRMFAPGGSVVSRYRNELVGSYLAMIAVDNGKGKEL